MRIIYKILIFYNKKITFLKLKKSLPISSADFGKSLQSHSGPPGDPESIYGKYGYSTFHKWIRFSFQPLSKDSQAKF